MQVKQEIKNQELSNKVELQKKIQSRKSLKNEEASSPPSFPMIQNQKA